MSVRERFPERLKDYVPDPELFGVDDDPLAHLRPAKPNFWWCLSYAAFQTNVITALCTGRNPDEFFESAS